MTLTTHGTEYFRDPELVRMALRGVKVHEVDGVKFDIYGAGAVLYSIVENSFPAHGGLSQIEKHCPEALRWIVRRAMTDLNSRYTSAGEMLADLRTVASAEDPFLLRPADLPSVSGASVEAPVTPRPEPAPEPAFVNVAAAATPVTPRPATPVDPTPAAAKAEASESTRWSPRLRVLNWFTGGYLVDSYSQTKTGVPRPDNVPGGPAVAAAVAQAGAAVHAAAQSVSEANQATQARRTPRPPRGPRTPGTPAKQQLHDARNRVKCAQKRARKRMCDARARREQVVKTRYNNGPNIGVGIAVFLFLAMVGFVVAMTVMISERQGGTYLVDHLDGYEEGQPVVRLLYGEDGETMTYFLDEEEMELPRVKLSEDGQLIASYEDSEAFFSPARPEGTVLVINRGDFNNRALSWALQNISRLGYETVGLGATERDIDIKAQAMHNGLRGQDPTAPGAVDMLRSWMHSSATELAYTLVIPDDESEHWTLIKGRGVSCPETEHFVEEMSYGY